MSALLGLALVVMLAFVWPGARAASAAVGSDPILTIAGTGERGVLGDGYDARQAQFRFASDVAIAPNGDVYVADQRARRVRRVDGNGVITTVAGTGLSGALGDGGPATKASLATPSGLTFDAAGNLYISDADGHRVRRVDTAGVITTVAGNGEYGSDGLGGPANQAQLHYPTGLAVGPDGGLYIADLGGNRVLRVDPAGIITRFAGDGCADECTFELGDGDPATAAYVNPNDVVADGQGNVFIADGAWGRIRKVDTGGVISTVTLADGLVDSVDLDGAGNLYFSGLGQNTVHKLDTAGVESVVAGTGDPGYDAPNGDGGPAIEGKITPWGMAVDRQGAVYVADGDIKRRVRRVGPERLFVTQTMSPALPLEGQLITFTFKATNYAATASTGAVLTDTLPADAQLVAGQSSPGCKATSGGKATCPLATIAAGATATAKVVVKIQTPGERRNLGTIISNEPEPYTLTNSSAIRVQVSAKSCGKVIVADTALGNDVGPCAGNGLVIGADNIALNLKGHKLFGFAGPSGLASDAAGIVVHNHTGVTIRDGTITQFDAGVLLDGGGSHTIKGLTLSDNVGTDDALSALLGDGIILFDSAANTISNNVVTHNGYYDGIGVFGELADDNRIVNNKVTSSLGAGNGQGIIVNGANDAGEAKFITGTLIADNTSENNSNAGISNINNTNSTVERNIVRNNGFNGIAVQAGVRAGEIDTNLLVRDNQVSGNIGDGIQVARRTHGARIIDNTSTGNGQASGGAFAGVFLFDLSDRTADCSDNVWSGNTWGLAFFNPPCTATGGTGPTPPAPAVLTALSSEPAAKNPKDGGRAKALARFADEPTAPRSQRRKP